MKRQRAVAVTLAAVGLCADLGAMIYRPEQGAMWDPSSLWHNGQFHAFMMYSKEGHNGLDAQHCLLATSKDGVHWQTEGAVNAERESAAGNKFFKCFVGRCGDRFIMDHGVARQAGQDVLRFYESSDLRNWKHLFSSSPDPRWYGLPPQPARWDHMYILPKEEGNPAAGYWGHVVAVPKPGDPPGVGMMESPDGRTWTVLPPAPMLWPEGMKTVSHFEYGGCERIGGKYYLIGGFGGILGFTGYSMGTLVADHPRGPFRIDLDAFRLCGSSSQTVAWLAAWCRSDGELLISNYASSAPGDMSPWLLPLRQPVIDRDGHLRLAWWPGNERLKGDALPLKENAFSLRSKDGSEAYETAWLDTAFDLQTGVILEGTLRGTTDGGQPAAGFVFDEGNNQSMAVLLGLGPPEGRQTHIGRLVTQRGDSDFNSEDVTGKYSATVTGLDPDREHHFRLLMRLSLFELYVEDRLMQTYTYWPASGRLGFVARNARLEVRDLRAWRMSLPAEKSFALSKPRAVTVRNKTLVAWPGLYHPAGMSMWDTWYLQRGDETHVFHLQLRRDQARRASDHESIGHAVSRDLIHWKELPVALRKGPKGSYDDSWALFTGCAVEHSNTVYLFYCGNHQPADRCRQSMCLATSPSLDGVTFTRYAGNPIIEPDPQRYYSIHEPPAPFKFPAAPHIDCRDLAVVKDPAGEGWLGYVMMRRKGQADAFHSACIALCRSKDLVHWEVGEPCCTPNRFSCFEVPDVFKLGDKWYLIALTGDVYGQSKRWSDPNITYATVVFQADQPEGPFEEVKDRLLLASTGPQGQSARTVERQGERLMLYTRTSESYARLAWPVKLVPRGEGGLNPTYWPGLDKAFGPPQSPPAAELDASQNGALHPLPGLSANDSTFMIAATVELKGAQAAGFAFGQAENQSGFGATLSTEGGPNGQVSLTRMPDGAIQDRHWPIRARGVHQLRLVVVERMVDVYVDDILVINRCVPELRAGSIGLTARGGAATFTEVQLYSPIP